MPEIHEDSLAAPTQQLLSKLARERWLSKFYLAGGTALALQLGHRTSVDLDFFTEKRFDEERIVTQMKGMGDLEIVKKEDQSVIGILDGVKFSFLGYEYPLLRPRVLAIGVQLASIPDIACMKLDALASRGTKRDFIDLYCIAKHIPLSELFTLFQEKYSSVRYNLLHIKKSLAYFEDAESDPLPDMRVPLKWEAVKEFFKAEAVRI